MQYLLLFMFLMTRSIFYIDMDLSSRHIRRLNQRNQERLIQELRLYQDDIEINPEVAHEDDFEDDYNFNYIYDSDSDVDEVLNEDPVEPHLINDIPFSVKLAE